MHCSKKHTLNASDKIKPDTDVVSVYIFETGHYTGFSSDCLHVNELEILSRKKRNVGRHQFVASRFLIKSIFLPELKSEWPCYTVEYLTLEKSVCLLKGDTVLRRLSLSHSGNWIAFTDNSTISAAIDVQVHNKSEPDIERLKQAFHEDDRALMAEEGMDFFFLWTAKEAYAKLVGLSIFDTLLMPMHEILKCCHVAVSNPSEGVSVAIATFRNAKLDVHVSSLMSGMMQRGFKQE